MRELMNFLGRLHPALVHLPIGVLVAAIIIDLLSRQRRYTALAPAAGPLYFIGMLSAIASAFSGYLLSLDGDYSKESLNPHMWMGFAVAAASLIIWLIRTRVQARVSAIGGVLLFVLLMITGHLGGSLTHGEGYLTAAFKPADVKIQRKAIADIQQAVVYTDIIEPIFAAKCYSCHGAKKQKGKLQMNTPELLMKGGKNGPVIRPGDLDHSELMKRVLLPLSDEHHMSPKEKPQLTSDEENLIAWWIRSSASFTARVAELEQSDDVKPLLAKVAAGDQAAVEEEVPVKVTPADPAVLEKLRALRVLVVPVAQGSNLLEVNLVNANNFSDKEMDLLLPLRKQVQSIRMSGARVGNAGIQRLKGFENLRRLSLANTRVSDAGMVAVAQLPELRSLNLSGTDVTAKGVEQLKGMKKLKTVYLFGAKVERAAWPALKAAMGAVDLDSGGYQVPLLPTDTVIEKMKPKS